MSVLHDGRSAFYALKDAADRVGVTTRSRPDDDFRRYMTSDDLHRLHAAVAT